MYYFLMIMGILLFAAGAFLFWTTQTERRAGDKEAIQFNKMIGVAFLFMASFLWIAAAYLPS